MTINDLGLAIIKAYEKCVLTPYLDDDTPKKWTIGWGHLLPFDERAHVNEVVAYLRARGWCDPMSTSGEITQETADAILREDVSKAEKAVEALVTVDEALTRNQFSALVSLVFNIGSGQFATSTILKYVNQKKWVAAQGQFHVWKKAGGKVLDGLIRRRSVEAFLFGLSTEFTPAFQWNVSAAAVSPAAVQAAAQAGAGSVLVVLQPVEHG